MESREDETYVALRNECGEGIKERALYEIAMSLGRIADMLAEMNRYIIDYDDSARQEKLSEAFHVGDEVQHILEDGRVMATRFVITSFSQSGLLNGIGKDGIAFCDKNPARWRKTGKHFVEAEKLMKALKADYDLD